MSTTPEEIIINKFAAAAATPFGPLGRAQVVRRTMPLLTQLTDDYALPWNSIADLFNQGMERAKGKTASAATLCRLYHLELDRQILKGRRQYPNAELGSSQVSINFPTEFDVEQSSLRGSSAQTQQSTSAIGGIKEQAPTTEMPNNRARDGPSWSTNLLKVSAQPNLATKALEHLNEIQKFEEARRKGK